MAEDRRMTAADVAASVIAGEHGDFVREAVALVARELMEAEVYGGGRCGARRGLRYSGHASQWVSPAAVGD